MTRKTTFIINPPTCPKRNRVPYDGHGLTLKDSAGTFNFQFSRHPKGIKVVVTVVKWNEPESVARIGIESLNANASRAMLEGYFKCDLRVPKGKLVQFHVSEKNFDPLFAFFKSFREPIVIDGVTFYSFDTCSNCMTIKAKSDWASSNAAVLETLEKFVGFKLLRRKNLSAREYTLVRAQELFGCDAIVRYCANEPEAKWQYFIYANKQDEKMGSCSGHGSSWDNALKVAVLKKTGWFFDNEVEAA